MKQIQTQKAVEQVEIDGKPYDIDLSDEKKQQHFDYRQQLLDAAEKANQIDSEDTEAVKQGLADLKNVTKEVTDGIMGDGVFDELYEKTGHSTEGVLDVMFQVIEYINERYQEKLKEKKKKYVKKR